MRVSGSVGEGEGERKGRGKRWDGRKEDDREGRGMGERERRGDRVVKKWENQKREMTWRGRRVREKGNEEQG